MAKLIRDAFSCRDAKYITVDEKMTNAHCSNKSNKTQKMQVSSNWLSMSYKGFYNIFIDISSVAFQQVIHVHVGIPMVTDCAPLVADLFLYSFKFSFMKESIRTKLPLAV